MDQKKEPSLSFGEDVDINEESYAGVEHQPEIVREDINETEKEKPVKKKKNWVKRKIEKIDNYLYDLEIIFSTSSDIKLERKARNVYILKSSLIFSFCLIFSYASSSGYFYVVNHIEQTQEERSQRLQKNGVPIIFSNEEIKSQN
jgi:hypothetical protein